MRLLSGDTLVAPSRVLRTLVGVLTRPGDMLVVRLALTCCGSPRSSSGFAPTGVPGGALGWRGLFSAERVSFVPEDLGVTVVLRGLLLIAMFSFGLAVRGLGVETETGAGRAIVVFGVERGVATMV